MQITKKALLVIILLMAMTFAHAISYSLTSHEINIQIAGEGNDTVIEKFFIGFPNETEKKAFRDKSLVLGTNIEEWEKFNPEFKTSLGQNTSNKKISYTEGGQNYLQISYDLSEPLMAKGKETTMVTEYIVKANYFNSFYQAGLWIIPDNTKISVELPPGAEIRDTVEPQANITTLGSRKIVTWEGYKSGNRLTLNYITWKKIDPVIDLNAITLFLFNTQEGMLLILIVVIIIAVVIWQRKKIAQKIEDFVETNSIIKEE